MTDHTYDYIVRDRLVAAESLRLTRRIAAHPTVMPTLTSANTNAPMLVIAERAARWMLEDARA